MNKTPTGRLLVLLSWLSAAGGIIAGGVCAVKISAWLIAGLIILLGAAGAVLLRAAANCHEFFFQMMVNSYRLLENSGVLSRNVVVIKQTLEQASEDTFKHLEVLKVQLKLIEQGKSMFKPPAGNQSPARLNEVEPDNEDIPKKQG